MKLRNAGRMAVTMTAAVFAISAMGGAFGTSVQQEFGECMDNATGGEPFGTDAQRLACCKQAGGAWVEIYDADGYVIDAFCDGAEEVYEPEEVRPTRTVNPAVLDNVVSGAIVVATSEPTPTPAPASRNESSSSGVVEEISSEPTPASDPAPAAEPKKKGKGKNKHRRHRR